MHFDALPWEIRDATGQPVDWFDSERWARIALTDYPADHYVVKHEK